MHLTLTKLTIQLRHMMLVESKNYLYYWFFFSFKLRRVNILYLILNVQFGAQLAFTGTFARLWLCSDKYFSTLQHSNATRQDVQISNCAGKKQRLQRCMVVNLEPSGGHWKMCHWHCAMTAESRRAASAIYSLISSLLRRIKALVISLSLSAVLNLSGLPNATAMCCAPVYSPPVMLNSASHLTRIQDSGLQSVMLGCSDVILKIPFIALFLISPSHAGLIGSHNESIQ